MRTAYCYGILEFQEVGLLLEKGARLADELDGIVHRKASLGLEVLEEVVLQTNRIATS